MADSKVFKLIDNLDSAAIGRAVEAFLREKKKMVAEGTQTPEGYFIQAKEGDEGWKKIAGMSKAVQVQMIQAGDVLTVNIGNGKWSDKLAAGAVGMLVFAPLAVTAAIGAVGQNKLPGEIFDYIEKFIESGGKSVLVSMSASMALKDGKILCPKCKKENDKGLKFCSECGSPLTNECPECGASVALGQKFCPECGSSMEAKKEEKSCPTCGHRVPDGMKFCPECGSSMITEKICASCGAKIIGDKKFCPECGTPVSGKKKCSNCGAEMEIGQKFCFDCGTKVE